MWLTILIALIATVGLIVWWLVKPFHCRLKGVSIEQIPRELLGAYAHIAAGGVIFIRSERSEHFAQFRKSYSRDIGKYLLFGFPMAEWSSEHFDNVNDLLTEAGFKTRITHTDVPEVPMFCEFDIVIDTAGDFYTAMELAIVVFLAVKEPIQGTFTLEAKGDNNDDLKEYRSLLTSKMESDDVVLQKLRHHRFQPIRDAFALVEG